MENQKKLLKFIQSLFVYFLKNIENKVEFLCEIMDQFVMSKKEADRDNLGIILLLIKEVQISLNEIISHYLDHFQCK